MSMLMLVFLFLTNGMIMCYVLHVDYCMPWLVLNWMGVLKLSELKLWMLS